MNNKLFISNLPYNLTEQELDAFFTQAGQVVSSKIITDKETGLSRGFAFVEMYSEEQTKKCLNQLNGLSLKGRIVKISLARPKEEQRTLNRQYLTEDN